MTTNFWKGLVLAAFIMASLAAYKNGDAKAPHDKQETTFERIIRTGTIRCGYIPFTPYFEIDPTTGAKSGIGYEFMMAIGNELGINVVWVEEVGWGTFYEGLAVNRYDMLCTPLWESGQRARVALLSNPLYGDKMYAYVRADDKRFDEGLASLNHAGVRIADYDSDITQKIRAEVFPLAQDRLLASIVSEGEYLLNVATQKVDAVLVGVDAANRYNCEATVKIKAVGGTPVRTFSNVLAMRRGDADLKAALDSTIHALMVSGKAAEIVRKYPGQTLPE